MMITKETVEQAREAAIRYRTTDKIAEYSRVKLQYALSTLKQKPPIQDEPPLLTAEHVEMARAMARDNPSVDNIARFATVKRYHKEDLEAAQ